MSSCIVKSTILCHTTPVPAKPLPSPSHFVPFSPMLSHAICTLFCTTLRHICKLQYNADLFYSLFLFFTTHSIYKSLLTIVIMYNECMSNLNNLSNSNEPSEKVLANFRLDGDVYQSLKEYAHINRRTINGSVNYLLSQALKERQDNQIRDNLESEE